MKKVFIGSTSRDLVEYRQAAIDACIELDFFPIAMEHFEAMGVGATEGSKRKLSEADVYVGIFAHRYGYIESGYDRSVTEIEFDYAGERGLERLCFLVDPAHPWPHDTTDLEHHDKLAAFKKRIDTLIRAQFTTVDSLKAKLLLALVKWRDGVPDSPLTPITGSLTVQTAVFARAADDVPDQPPKLIGRDVLVSEVNTLLDQGQRVLLHGFGGMGKTVLAAAITAGRVGDSKGPALWLKTGSAEAGALFEALARPFDAHRAVASQTGDAQIAVVRQMIGGSGARLLVLDDVWNGEALHTALKAVPRGLPVLITSRQRYPLDGSLRQVGDLEPAQALELLSFYAGRDLANDPAAGDLCEKLGRHAFALEVAAKNLKEDDLSAGELLRRIQDAPHTLRMPEDFADAGRRSFGELIEVSLNALDAESRRVFLAFGALFAPRATPELLALLIERELSAVESLLTTLARRGLAERVPPSDDRACFYRVHDLSYSYAKAQTSDEQRGKALEACINYTKRYNTPSLANFAALRPEIDNFLGAAGWAMSAGRYAEVERFAWNLYVNSEVLDYSGYYIQAVGLLSQAAEAAARQDHRRDQASHLLHLGNNYKNLGQVAHAIEFYQQSLDIDHEIGHRSGEANSLMGLGLVYADLGQVERAIEFYQQALVIQREIGDRRGEGADLGNLGNAYRNLGQVERAIEYYQQALVIDREIGDRRGEGADLGNLGIAYRNLGQVERAIEYYQQALVIDREIGDRRGEGNQLGNLGLAYADLGQVERAIDFYQQALVIRREIGDRRGEGNDLGNLGLAYADLGQVERAIEYYQQALVIRREIGDRMGESNDLNNLGVVYEKQGELERALDHYQQSRVIYAEIGAAHLVARSDQRIARVRTKLGGGQA
ncbi:MAG: tetratricopeptide repeat protein [Chloroflexi bacterium]|nr:tetratricopeptide repeat protein [Chloroflexota bacterium]